MARLHVAIGVGVEHVLQVRGDQLAHALDGAGQRRDRLGLGEDQGALGDVLGEVAAALQFAGDASAGQHDAQVVGERLAQREQLDGAALDFALRGVELLVALDHRSGPAGVAPGDGGEAVVDAASARPPMRATSG